MLVLSRRLNESIIIGDQIRITVVGLRGNHVRLGIEAPEDVAIMRQELLIPAPEDAAARPSAAVETLAAGDGDGVAPIARRPRSIRR
jgi:carbon storage regulator